MALYMCNFFEFRVNAFPEPRSTGGSVLMITPYSNDKTPKIESFLRLSLILSANAFLTKEICRANSMTLKIGANE